MNPAKNPDEPTFGQGFGTRLKTGAARIAAAVMAVGIIFAVPAAGSEEMPLRPSVGPSQAGLPLGFGTGGNGAYAAGSGSGYDRAQLNPGASTGIGEEAGSSVNYPTRTPTALPPKQKRILDITIAAGSNPTDEQFWDSVHKADEMTGGDSESALGEIMCIRDQGTDNPLLACLDHYYNARMAVSDCSLPGLMLAKVLIANAGYSFMKALTIPVPQDTEHPPSPVTLQQWIAGNYGAADGLFPNNR